MSKGSSTDGLAEFRAALRRVREAGVADRVEVLLRDYRDLEGTFDLVIFSEPFNLHVDALRSALGSGEQSAGPGLGTGRAVVRAAGSCPLGAQALTKARARFSHLTIVLKRVRHKGQNRAYSPAVFSRSAGSKMKNKGPFC